MKCLGALCAVVATVSSPANASPRCITPNQMQAIVHVALPSFVDAAVTRCTPLLPETAYLARQGPVLRLRFAKTTNVDGDAIRAALSAFVGKEAPTSITTEVVAALLATGLVQEFGLDKMKPDQCRSVSTIMEPLDSLPRERFEALVSAIFAVASQRDKRFVICGAER